MDAREAVPQARSLARRNRCFNKSLLAGFLGSRTHVGSSMLPKWARISEPAKMLPVIGLKQPEPH